MFNFLLKNEMDLIIRTNNLILYIKNSITKKDDILFK